MPVESTLRRLCVLSENRVDLEDLGIPSDIPDWESECLALAEAESSRLPADVLLLAMPPESAGLRRWLARFRIFNPGAHILLAEYEESMAWYRSAISLGVDGLLRLPLDADGWRETLIDCAEALAASEAQRRLMGHLERSSHSLEESRRQLADMLLNSYENLGRVHSQLEARLGQLSILYSLGRDLNRESNWDEALERFLGSCVDTLEFGGVALMLWSFDQQRLAVRAERALAGETLARSLRLLKGLPDERQLASGIFGIRRGEVLTGDALLESVTDVELLVMPLVQGEEAEGFLVFNKAYQGAAQLDDDFHFLKTVQTLLSEALAGAKAVSRLKRLGEFNRSVLESVHAAVLTVNGKGVVSYRNARAADLFGERLDVGDAFRFDEGFRLTEGDALGLEDRDWIQRECRLIPREAADAEERRLLLSVTCLPMRHESDTRHVMVCEDLTEYKRLEDELRRAERLSSLGQLSAGMAHEIRNPLAGIAMTTQVLQSRLADRPETEPYLQRIQAEIQRLERIVRSLLEYSRPARPSLRTLDMAEAARVAVGDLRGTAEQAGVALAVIEEELAFPARADRDQIQQVLLNLLQNAIQACSPGESAGLRLERAAAVGGEGSVRVIVWDSGPGVPESAASKLFDPFYTTKAEGTGLGLSVCQQIIKEHGGQIRYRPREGGGAEFIVELLAADDHPSHEEK